jgi:hypothetical protein
MSALCHKRTHAAQQNSVPFDYLVGERKQIVRNPGAQAVFKLTNIRNLVAYIIGKSAGYSPLKTHPA